MKFCHFCPPGKIFLAALEKIQFCPLPGNNPSDAHERSMLFLSPDIVYWLQTLLHWCDNKAIFIDEVSRVYANSLPQKIGKKQNQKCTHTLHFWKISEWYTNKRIKNVLEIPICWTISHVLTIPAYLWLNTNHLRNFWSDGLTQDKSFEEIINH